VDEILGDFSKRLPHVTRDEMTQAVAKISVSPKMLDAVRHAVDHHGATVVIVSDANEVFIRSMLDHHRITSYFTEVHTNRAEWEHHDDTSNNRLRLRPYHPLEAEPHGCEWCPTNMCKGRVWI
jgi:pyridoxal phosphate phosphatase PHOSPHO2